MAFGEFSIRRKTRRELTEPLRPLPEERGLRFRLSVKSDQLGAGHWRHTILHENLIHGTPADGQTYFAEIDIPVPVARLQVLDPFVMMLAFVLMKHGGVIEVAGPVSRRLIRNLAEIQAQSHNRWPETFKPFAIEPISIVEAPYPETRRSDGIASLTGGLDSTLSLYRQTDAALQQSRFPIAIAVTVVGYNPPQNQVSHDYEARHVDRLRRIGGRRGIEIGVIRTDLWRVADSVPATHGGVLSGLFALAAPTFPFAVFASSTSNADAWRDRGVAPEWQWSYGSGGFDIHSDLGFFTRAERLALLAGYGEEALGDLSVCGTAANLPDNCGRCGKCVRTMLTFEAAGLPIPSCFPPLAVKLIGRGGSYQPETGYHTEILRLADALGTDHRDIRILRRRYLRKALKRRLLDTIAGLRWN